MTALLNRLLHRSTTTTFEQMVFPPNQFSLYLYRPSDRASVASAIRESKMKFAFVLLFLAALFGCFPPAIEAGKSTSKATISAAKIGGVAAQQAAKATREQRRIVGVDKGR